MNATQSLPTSLVSPSYLGREVYHGPQWVKRALDAAAVQPVEVRNGTPFYREDLALPVVEAAAAKERT